MNDKPASTRPWILSPPGLAVCTGLLVVGILLFSEHRAHTIAVLPYLLLLACPLMHLFMRHHHPRGGP